MHASEFDWRKDSVPVGRGGSARHHQRHANTGRTSACRPSGETGSAPKGCSASSQARSPATLSEWPKSRDAEDKHEAIRSQPSRFTQRALREDGDAEVGESSKTIRRGPVEVAATALLPEDRRLCKLESVSARS